WRRQRPTTSSPSCRTARSVAFTSGSSALSRRGEPSPSGAPWRTSLEKRNVTCPCGKGESFEKCCGPFLEGHAKPKTAEELMRSRYTAFTRGDVDYVMKTHDPDTVHQVDRRSTEEWAKQSEWLGFELLKSEAGGPEDFHGTIEFVARYRIKGVTLEHRERATFRRQDD